MENFEEKTNTDLADYIQTNIKEAKNNILNWKIVSIKDILHDLHRSRYHLLMMAQIIHQALNQAKAD
jgi:hypothetical protein